MHDPPERALELAPDGDNKQPDNNRLNPLDVWRVLSKSKKRKLKPETHIHFRRYPDRAVAGGV